VKDRGVKSFIYPSDITPFQLGIAENLAARLRLSGLMRLKYKTGTDQVIATRFGDTTIIDAKSIGGYAQLILWNPVTLLNDMYSRALLYFKSFGVTVATGYANVVEISSDYITLFWVTDFPYVKARYWYDTRTLKYIGGLVYPASIIDMGGEGDGYLVLGLWWPEWDTDNGIYKHLADPQKQDGDHVFWMYLYSNGVYTGKAISYTCTDSHFSVPMSLNFQTDALYVLVFDADVVNADVLGYVYDDSDPFNPEERKYVYDHRTHKTNIDKYDYDLNLLETIEWDDFTDFAAGGDHEFTHNPVKLQYGKVEILRWYKHPNLIGNYYAIPYFISKNNTAGKFIIGYNSPMYFRVMDGGVFEADVQECDVVPFPFAIDNYLSIFQMDHLGPVGNEMWYLIGCYAPPLGLSDNTAYIYTLDMGTLGWSETIKALVPNSGYYLSGVAGDF
jgi:hypothetical protein